MQKRIFFLTLVCFACACCGVWASTAEQMAAQENEFDAHRQYVQIHFNDDEMDFALQWILGSTSLGGCEIGEAFYAVGQIDDGSPESWQKGWREMAERTEERAEKSLAAGHRVSARDAFMRASNYYRTAVVSMMPDNPDFKTLGDKSRECLKNAGKLFEIPMEYVEIPFEGTVLPGYVWKARKGDEPTKTIIMIGGGETFIEDTFFYLASQAVKRGYNFVTFDIPGQGMLPLEGKFYRPDTEVPIGAILDYVLTRKDVDPEKLVMYGISGGGCFVPRAATVDKRIKAIAVNSAIVNQGDVFANMPIADATPEVLKDWPAFKRQTAGVVAWRWGLDTTDLVGLVEANRDFTYDPVLITCPALVLLGEGEYASKEIQEQQKLFYDGISSKVKDFVVTPANQGASSHCIGENRSVMAEVVFNWFDEVLK